MSDIEHAVAALELRTEVLEEVCAVLDEEAKKFRDDSRFDLADVVEMLRSKIRAKVLEES